MKKYCKECGCEIEKSTRRCSGCGRYYFRPAYFILMLLYLALIASTVFYYVQYQNSLYLINYHEDIVNQEFESRFGHLTHPETGEYIDSWYDYLDALDTQMELEGESY